MTWTLEAHVLNHAYKPISLKGVSTINKGKVYLFFKKRKTDFTQAYDTLPLGGTLYLFKAALIIRKNVFIIKESDIQGEFQV